MDSVVILEQKPFQKDIAIKYAILMSTKYNKIYAITQSTEKDKEDCADIIGIDYYRQHITDFKLIYISMPHDKIPRTTKK